MKIQSLSIVVPNKGCINNCKFCVSRMHCDTYKNHLDDNLPLFDLYLNDYIKRLEFARDNGCNTVMLTGTSEPQQNRKFLTYFGMMMHRMQRPFRWIEMQTTGVMLNENYLRFLRNHVGVSTISLSLSSLDYAQNAKIIDCPFNSIPVIGSLCEKIKKYDFTLRLSLNMTSEFDGFMHDPWNLFNTCKAYGADQVTIRMLYSSGTDTEQDEWIRKNGADPATIESLTNYVEKHGKVLGVLPHGAVKYSIDGLCVVIDRDCMDKAEKDDENYKYLILQPDCKLYSQWDDPASLIF